MVRDVSRQMAGLGVLLSAALFFTGRSDLVWGFALGVAASLANCVLLGRQLEKAADLPMDKAIAQVQIGWFVRFTLAVFLLALSALFVEIRFLAALAGLFVFQLILVLRAAFAFLRGLKTRQTRKE